MKAKWIHKIETSSYCNLKCQYCPNSKGLIYGHDNMSQETFDRVCHWAKILNPIGQPDDEPYIWLHGIGEPLLNPNILNFVKQLSLIVKVGFSTNGILLTPEFMNDLEQAGLSYLTVSQHKKKIIKPIIELYNKHRFKFTLDIQAKFNDDWAGQINKEDVPHKEKRHFPCAHIEKGGVHVLWNGNIVNCCVDAQSFPILGSVYDDEIRDIDIDIIPLCKTCRNAKYVIQKELRKYSNTLMTEEKAKLLWEQVERDTNHRNRPDYFMWGIEKH